MGRRTGSVQGCKMSSITRSANQTWALTRNSTETQ